jgi:hypothetical protein
VITAGSGSHPQPWSLPAAAALPQQQQALLRRQWAGRAGGRGLFDEDDPFFHPHRGRGINGPDSHYREGQYDRETAFSIEEERQFEEQRQLRCNEHRTIGFRGNDRGQQSGHRNRGVYHQQLRYRNGSSNRYYDDNEQEEEDDEGYLDEDDPSFRGNNCCSHYRR